MTEATMGHVGGAGLDLGYLNLMLEALCLLYTSRCV